MTTVWDINLFYPLLFFTIVIILGLITFCFFKTKDTNIFFRHSDEHEDTTTKMSKMHDNVVHVDFGKEHELELDVLERGLKELQDNVKELNDKVDLLIRRVIEIENQHK